MSTFFESWQACMHRNGFPVPSVEDAKEAVELLHQLNQALENAGGEVEMTIGALIAAGALVGIDEGVLVVLGDVAQVAATVYIGTCIGCIGSVALPDLRRLFASNELPGFVVDQLNGNGIDLTITAVA
jgi:hypothetical protein